MSLSRQLILVGMGCVWAGLAMAQAPPASPSPAPSSSPAVTPAPVATPAPAAALPIATTPAPTPTCTFDEPCVRADRQGRDKERYWAEGFVDIRAGEVRIQCDRVETVDQPALQGGTTRILTATGNVVFLRDEERMAGRKLVLDLGTGRGTFEQAAGYVDPGVFIEGRTLERLSADTYKISGGRFTSCSQPTPRWSFSTSSATIKLDRRITAKNVLFRVKDVPAFYIPYLTYPIQRDQRATGFLFPHFGSSSARGFNVGAGFFWAMGRSFDQTFYADNYSRFGVGFGHEFRYALASPSRGTFRTYVLRPKVGGDLDYDLDWNAMQGLPGRARATLAVRLYSDLAFQNQIQESLNRATTRRREATFNVQKSFGGTQVQLLAESQDTFFLENDSREVRRRVPALRISRNSQRLGRSGVVFSYQGRAELLQRGSATRLDTYSRFDAIPQVSRPFGPTFLQVTPRVGARYTRYGASLVGARTTGAALDRRFFESSVELKGPTLSRVFNTPGNFYSERFKHVIGPEVLWTYRTRVEEFARIPRFDGLDQLLGTNQVEYALVQSLLAKRPGPAGKAIPYEFLTWRVSQTYYVDIADGQNNFDPNYSSASFGADGQASHYSAVQSSLRVRPSPRTRADFNLQYDVNFKQLRNIQLSTGLEFARGNLEASWARVLRASAVAAERIATIDTLRGAGQVQLLPRRLTLTGSADYDAVNKSLVQVRGKLRYEVQCCGFSLTYERIQLNGYEDRTLRFSLDLANIGQIGNFMGGDERASGWGAYR